MSGLATASTPSSPGAPPSRDPAPRELSPERALMLLLAFAAALLALALIPPVQQNPNLRRRFAYTSVWAGVFLLARGQPPLVVASGSKGPMRESDPARVQALACERGWSE